jgi:transposase
MFPSAYPRLVKILADGGYGVYRPTLGNWPLSVKGWTLEIVHRIADGGFKVLRQRWKVERTFAWIGRCRRLSKNHEQLSITAEGMLYLASIRIMLRQLVKQKTDFYECNLAWTG